MCEDVNALIIRLVSESRIQVDFTNSIDLTDQDVTASQGIKATITTFLAVGFIIN